jgi:hypothetical protein
VVGGPGRVPYRLTPYLSPTRCSLDRMAISGPVSSDRFACIFRRSGTWNLLPFLAHGRLHPLPTHLVSSPKFPHYLSAHEFRVSPDLALPRNKDPPTVEAEPPGHQLVMTNVLCEAPKPWEGILPWNSRPWAQMMTVPIAPVDKDDELLPMEDDVRGSR